MAFGQNVYYKNKKGVEFASFPANYTSIDTIVTKTDSLTKSLTLIGSVPNFNLTELIVGSNPYSKFKNYQVEVEITNSNLFIGSLAIDTNNVFAGTIFINAFSNGAKRVFVLDNFSNITFRYINSNNSGTVDFDFTIKQQSTKISIETGLPSFDTVYVDLNNNNYNQIPSGYMPYDTLTKKMDSMIIFSFCTTANVSPQSCSFNFNVNFPYPQFYCEIILYAPYGKGSRQYVDTNGVRYKYIPNRNFTPVIGWYYFSDTLVVDSTTLFDIGMSGGNGDAMFMDFEAFVTQTKVYIRQAVGLEDYYEKPKFKIFPNPARSTLKVSGENFLNKQYQILDVTGKLIRSARFNSNEIDLRNLTGGIYFLSVPELQLNQKFIKQ